MSLLAALVAVWRVDPQATGGIKGDEATYVGMAASLAFEADLQFDDRDYRRFQEWYGSGPEGIFLKRGSDGRLHFGKAYVYAVLAAPFARGGPRGLLVFNLVCLLATIGAGWWWLSGSSASAPAAGFALLFALAAATPIYAAWLTSDLVTYALVFTAFAAAWARGTERVGRARVALAIALLAAAIFSKPLNVFLALPLAAGAASSIKSRAAIVAACAAGVLALFAVNALLTGELNYQGGDRRTFYGHFPYDEHGHDFHAVGIGMATNTVATPVGGEGRLATVGANTGYFIYGRHFGLLTFGWPWLLCGVWWLLAARRKTLAEWSLVAACATLAAVTILWMPYTWSGGGGPVGNRYFLSAGAALFFLMPPLRSWSPVALSAAGLIFVAPALAQPLAIARQPWLATRAPQFALFPVELTGASDLPIILDQRRGRVPQGRDPVLFAALLDARAEVGRSGWIAVAAGARSEILVRGAEVLDGVTVGVKSPGGCTVGLDGGRGAQAITVGPDGRQDTRIAVRQVFSREAFVFVLDVDARACDAPIEIAFQGHRLPSGASQ